MGESRQYKHQNIINLCKLNMKDITEHGIDKTQYEIRIFSQH